MNAKIIKLDINKKIYQRIVAKQRDVKSRYLFFHLLDGAVPFNLTGKSVRVYAIKPDGAEIFNDLQIVDAAKGICKLELTTQILAIEGIVLMEVMITEGLSKLTSNIFELEVGKSINSEAAIVSTNEFTALVNGLASLSEYDKYKAMALAWDRFQKNGGKISGIVEATKFIASQFRRKVTTSTIESGYSAGFGIESSDASDSVVVGIGKNGAGDKIMAPIINNQYNLGDIDQAWKDLFLGISSRAPHGYAKISNKLYIQWGEVVMNVPAAAGSGSSKDIVLPVNMDGIAFGFAICEENRTWYNTNSIEHMTAAVSCKSSTEITVKCSHATTLAQIFDFKFKWFVLGW